MKAHDVRHLRVCPMCGDLGDGREMVNLPPTGFNEAGDEASFVVYKPGPYHGACVAQRLSHDSILSLPPTERSKFRLSEVSPELMRKLLDASGVPPIVEPVAWMTDETPPRVASAYTKTSMPKPSKESFCIPLYTTAGVRASDEDVYLVTEVQHRGVLLVTLRTDEQPLQAQVGDKVVLRPAGVTAGPLHQVAAGMEALDAGHDPLCMAVLRGKECTCGVTEVPRG